MNIVDVAKKYQEVYKASKGRLGYWPVLAGGAIRSALMGEEPKDWDFYVSATDLGMTADEEGGFQFYRSLSEEFNAIAPPAPEEYQISGLAPAGHFEIAGVDCNIILSGVRVPVEDTFDFISSTGVYTGNRFKNLDAVACDIAEGILRINNRHLNKNQVRSSLGRIKKFKERYGWELSPEAQAQFFKWRGEFYLFD